MATQVPVVRVGVAAVVLNAQGRMVMGTRKGSHGDGHLQFPGGHLEMGESYLRCAERETREETGLDVQAQKLVAVTNDIFDPTSKHYITLFVQCRRLDETQEPQVLEPEKCESWEWKSWSDVRALISSEPRETKVFLPIVNLLRENPDIERLVGPHLGSDGFRMPA